MRAGSGQARAGSGRVCARGLPTGRSAVHGSGWILALCAVLAPLDSFAQPQVEESAKTRETEVHARVDVSQLYGADPATTRYLLFSDLRLRADATGLLGAPLALRLDGRARKSWNELAEDRLTPTEALLRWGEDGDGWRIAAGRQLIRAAASAEVDGLALERRLGEDSYAIAFGGLQPHPATGAFNADFATAGAGYEARGKSANHAGGLVLSSYKGELDRLYATQRAWASLGPKLLLSGFAVVDLAAPHGLLAAGGESGEKNVDLTNLHALLRYRPARWLDSSLSASHVHTILPSRWWADYLAQRRRAQGFVLDGEEPVGTRISSLRWTNTFHVAPWAAPYLRLRHDWRHTDPARGWEALAGFKWRPRFGYADLSWAWREHFNANGQLASARLGFDQPAWGAEGGAALLRSRPHGEAADATGYDLDALLWLEAGQLARALDGVRLVAQVQTFIEPQSVYHTVFTQLGYRF